MNPTPTDAMNALLAVGVPEGLKTVWYFLQIFIGFSLIIFVHELGHFLAAKWAGVRVEQFAIGFFREIYGFTWGETRYSFNLLPLGGYVKMLGQEDFEIDASGEFQASDDPRSFVNKSIGRRMVIVSAGVVMNLLFAGLLFMIVFMIGMEVMSPKIGAVLPDQPAALAGLQPGDVVRAIDGEETNEFNEITMAIVLSKPGKPLDFEVERDGQIRHVEVHPERDPARDVFQVGITSAQSATLVGVGAEYQLRNEHDPRVGDRIVQIGDMKVTDMNANRMMNLLLSNPLAFRQVVVERPEDPLKKDSPTERMTVDLKPQLKLERGDVSKNSSSLLGLVPFRRISEVVPGGRADLAGLEVGDTILEWDGVRNPTAPQIDKDIVESAERDPNRPEQDIPVKVMKARTGRIENLTVRPKVRITPLLGKRSRPNIGAGYQMIASDWLRVASIVPDVAGTTTPAEAAGIPANATISTVNGESVSRWIELAQMFCKHAGEDVTIAYRDAANVEHSVEFHVPQSLRAALGIGPGSKIVSVDGKDSAEVEINDRKARVTVSHPFGLRAALEECVGKTVEVKYRPNILADTKSAKVKITEEMTYPWIGLIGYTIDLIPGAQTEILRKASPIAAIKVGVKKTYYFVMQVYQTMQRMIFSRSVGVENISGPLGIVEIGRRTAEKGPVDLLFFLAVISANLAVINFLPLPIVDGGLMVFLIIEKIKGSPISIRVQVATQVIGLILIISAFLFVTLQDIARF